MRRPRIGAVFGDVAALLPRAASTVEGTPFLDAFGGRGRFHRVAPRLTQDASCLHSQWAFAYLGDDEI
jgi:hypothetical protein